MLYEVITIDGDFGFRFEYRGVFFQILFKQRFHQFVFEGIEGFDGSIGEFEKGRRDIKGVDLSGKRDFVQQLVLMFSYNFV